MYPIGEVDHDDDAAEFLGELGPLVHLLHRGGGHVEVVALDFAGLLGGPVHGLHDEQVSVPPAHEGLGVDVLVVLGEVETAAQRLVDHPAVVARGEPELRLGRRAEQRAPVLVEVLALHDDAVRRAGKGLHVVQRDPHVLKAQRAQRLEAEHVADDRRRQVGDGSLLEEIDVISDIGDVLVLPAGHRVDPVALGLVVVVGGEPVGPYDGPGGGRRLAGHRGARFLGRNTWLRRHPERGEHVGVLRLVVRLPEAHLGVGDHPCVPAVARHRSSYAADRISCPLPPP